MAAKAALGALKPAAAVPTASLGSEPIGGRYRVWNFNLPPQKAVAVSRHTERRSAEPADGDRRRPRGASGCIRSTPMRADCNSSSVRAYRLTRVSNALVALRVYPVACSLRSRLCSASVALRHSACAATWASTPSRSCRPSPTPTSRSSSRKSRPRSNPNMQCSNEWVETHTKERSAPAADGAAADDAGGALWADSASAGAIIAATCAPITMCRLFIVRGRGDD